MSIQNILVAYNGTASSKAALSYAAFMAGAGTAHVTALLAHAAHEEYASLNRWLSPQAREIIASGNDKTVMEIERIFAVDKDQFGLDERLTFQMVGGRVDAIIAQCARAYDLLVLGEANQDNVDEHAALNPDQVALLSGKPVVVIRNDYDAQADHGKAVIAWDGKRSTARALSDAMHILENDGHVTLLTIGSKPLPRPIEEVMRHLRRHGIKVDHTHRSGRAGVAETILGFCHENDPGLLVMGAYEHSKFRVDLLGGITSIVLKTCPVPVLISH